MTEIEGSLKQIGQGKTQKTFNYEPLDSLVDIIFNSAGKLLAVFSADHRLTKPNRPSPPGDCAEGQEQRRWKRRRLVCFGVVHAHARFPARQYCCEHVYGSVDAGFLVVITKYNLCLCDVLSRGYPGGGANSKLETVLS